MKKSAAVLFLSLLALVSCGQNSSITTSASLNSSETKPITSTNSNEDKPSTSSTEKPNSSTTNDKPNSSSSSQGGGSSVEPDPEPLNVLTLNPNNFAAYPAIEISNVVPNAEYDEEFTMQKDGSYIKSTNITQIVKIEVSVFGKYDNLKMYDGSSNQGTLVEASVETDGDTYGIYTYEFENETDAFYLENPSSYDVHLYYISIYYNGIINEVEPVIPETPGEIHINGVTYNYLDNITCSGVEQNPNNPLEILIKPNGFIKGENINQIKSISYESGDYNSISVYKGSDATAEEVSFHYTVGVDIYLYEFSGENSFYIVNDSEEDATFGEILVEYTSDEKPTGEEISIAEAIEIASGLEDGATTEDFYLISGQISSMTTDQFTITDGTDEIICYFGKMELSEIHVKYQVTLLGKIQNYYGTYEITEFTIEECVPATYDIKIETSEHGHIEASKSTGINYGEEITLTGVGDEGYKVSAIYANGEKLDLDENRATIQVTNDLTITAEFVTEDTPIISTETRNYVFSDYPAGTQYAVNEEHVLDDYLTVITTQAHFTGELRLYSSSTHNGNAVLKSTNYINAIKLNIGYKTDTLSIFGSIDGAEYTPIDEIVVTSTSYNDYSLNIPATTYKYLKFDVLGDQQLRIKNMSITFEK